MATTVLSNSFKTFLVRVWPKGDKSLPWRYRVDEENAALVFESGDSRKVVNLKPGRRIVLVKSEEGKILFVGYGEEPALNIRRDYVRGETRFSYRGKEIKGAVELVEVAPQQETEVSAAAKKIAASFEARRQLNELPWHELRARAMKNGINPWCEGRNRRVLTELILAA